MIKEKLEEIDNGENPLLSLSFFGLNELSSEVFCMIIEQPPLIYRALYPKSLWRIPKKDKKTVYLTFDDGPIPEVTPWVLDTLRDYNIKATFFCVGDNVRKYPEIYKRILQEGHRTGNHTFNHLQGWLTWPANFILNTQKASQYIQSTLFRPPHGHMIFPQPILLKKLGYKIVMWDVVTRDYNPKLTPEQVFDNVKRFTRNGSIIVFHDSLKAEKNMKYTLPRAIEWLQKSGYELDVL